MKKARVKSPRKIHCLTAPHLFRSCFGAATMIGKVGKHIDEFCVSTGVGDHLGTPQDAEWFSTFVETELALVLGWGTTWGLLKMLTDCSCFGNKSGVYC